MPRLLAIDWDAREIGLALATVANDRVTLETVETISLARTSDDLPLTDEELGKQLQNVLARHKRSSATILVGVDRNAIELFELTVPPAGDAELPNLVANQVSMESPSLAEESVIDFIARRGAATEPRQVTAAALSRTEFERMNAICSIAGIRPDHLLMRHYATASLFFRHPMRGDGNALLVNVIDHEVDLIVVDHDQVLFFRTVRLPGGLGNESAEKRLLDEVRRTLLVAPQSVTGGKAIESVQIFGTSPDHDRLVQQIAKQISVKAEKCDPFAGFVTGNESGGTTSGRVVPLLGMLVEETKHGSHAMDFVHPRRPPTPPNRRRQLTIAATVLALVGGLGGYYVWDTFSTADAEIKRIADDLADLESLVKKTAEKKKVIDALDDWNTNSVVWLDEIRDLSAKFPSGQDLVLQRLTMSPARGGRASIAFQGLAREPNVVTRMEATLRDSRHEVQTPRVDERVQDKTYTWNFETSISLSAAKQEAVAEAVPDNRRTTPKSAEKKSSSKQNTSEKGSKAKTDSGAKATEPPPSAKPDANAPEPLEDPQLGPEEKGT